MKQESTPARKKMYNSYGNVIKSRKRAFSCPGLSVMLAMLIAFGSCTKEKIVYVEVLRNQGNDTYVFDNLIGNVRINIYNTPNSYSITVVNGPGSVVGCAIRNYRSPSTIYFSDAFIYKGVSQTQSSAANGIPVGEKLELKLVVYDSTVSSAIYRLIEALGLDFWDGINNYKEHITDEYTTLFVLE
jgi:hypothetical protein